MPDKDLGTVFEVLERALVCLRAARPYVEYCVEANTPAETVLVEIDNLLGTADLLPTKPTETSP